jgi:cytosine deaminase
MISDDFWLTNLVTPAGERTALHVAAGRIAGYGTPQAGATTTDARGRLILPSLIEGHVHLDKVLWGTPWPGYTSGTTVKERIAREKAFRGSLSVPVEARGGLLVEAEIAFGTGHLRSHVDIDPDWGLDNLHAAQRIRERYADRIDIEIVAFPQSGILAAPGTADLLDAALREGADLIGGLDPAYIDGDPKGSLDIVFGLAEKHGRGVDIHLHEGGPLGLFELDLIAERTRALSLGGKVTVSHAYCLGETPIDALAATAETLARAGVSILTSAPEHSMPPLRPLWAAGVTVFCGNDNIRDSWSPFGSGDLLERANIAARQQNLVSDEELLAALNLVTGAAAEVMGLDGYGLAPGDRADFVLVDAPSVPETIAAPPRARVTFKAGKLVAGTL